METRLADWFKDTSDGKVADAILRACVHCGFCTATCPTYQVLGDEKDGPRGRIYLMKQVMEGAQPTVATMTHLDRCLTCRNCESTCPSGVQYGHLLDIGRRLVEERVERPLAQRAVRALLRETLTRRWLFDPAMRVGRVVRPFLPAFLQAKIPPAADHGEWPSRSHGERVLLLNGCTQPGMLPGIDVATARILDRMGVQAVVAEESGCCGSLRHHLDDPAGALNDARRNIDAWWPHLMSGVEAIVINASGCGVMVKDYGHLLRDDPQYAEKAARVSASTVDAIEWIGPRLERLHPPHEGEPGLEPQRVAFHPPCTLQHGQKIRGQVEALLVAWGATLTVVPDSHLCCGSAGTYSLLQPELSKTLRDRKLDALHTGKPEVVLSANIGCLAHLASGTDTPVRHWIEWLETRTRRLDKRRQARIPS